MPESKHTGFADDLALLKDAASEAGELAATMFRTGVESWDKADKTPITEADLAVNELLYQRLTQARPGYGWLSEETVDAPDRLACARTWVVDPIDGTRGFIRGTDQWCISAGLVENGIAVAGVIVRPLAGEVYEAASGRGAFLNGTSIAVHECNAVEGCRLMMHEHVRNSKKWGRPWPPLETSMSTSMALRLCYVAAGNVDATIAISGKSDWDLAAADVLVREAGGQISTMAGSQLLYNQQNTRHDGILAASSGLHAALLDHTRQWKLAG